MKKFILIVILLFLNTAQVNSQVIKVKTYTPEDGLPDLFIYDITQDTSGRMWFASRKGISSYDATEWKLYNDEKDIPVADYYKFKIDEKNILWALPKRSTRNIINYQHKKWNLLPPLGMTTRNNFFIDFDIIYKDNNPIIFTIVSYKDIYYYFQDKWDKLDNINSRGEISDIKAIDNKIYFIKNDSLFYIDNNFNVTLISNPDIPDNLLKLSISKNFPEDKSIWLLGKNWIGKLKDEKFKNITKFKIPKSFRDELFFLISSNSDKIFFGNLMTIYSCDKNNGKIDTLGRRNNINAEGAVSIFEDRESNLWIATRRGIHKIKQTPFINYFVEDGLLENEVTAVNQFNSGELVFGHKFGFTILDQSNFTNIKFNVTPSWSSYYSRILSLQNPPDDDIWFIAHQLGIGKINKIGSITWINNEIQLGATSIYFDDDKTWVGTSNGIHILENGLLKRPQNFPVYDDYVRNITRYNKDYLIFSAVGGIFITGENYLKEIENANDPTTNNSFCIYKRKNQFLIGTMDGLFYIDSNSLILKKYYDGNFSIESSVYWINEDKHNNLWFGTDDGVVKWDGSVKERFSVADGLAGYETNRGTGFFDNEGKLWIGTDKGLSCYHPDLDDKRKVKPKAEFLYLQDFEGNKFDLNNNTELNYDQNSFTINFRGISFIDENSISYKVIVKNTTTGWIDEFITTSANARFTNLEPGKYIFTLSVNNGKNIWSNKIQSADVFIDSPYYNQAWFYFVLIVGAGIIIFSGQHYYQQRKYSHKLEEEVKDRTKLLQQSEEDIRNLTQELLKVQEIERQKLSRDLHDNVAQDLSTLKVNLSSFFDRKRESSTESNKEIENQINLLENSIKSVRDLSYNLRPPEIDQFGLIQSVQEYCEEYEENYKVKIDFIATGFEHLSFQQDSAINIYRIIQEALHNVRKHSEAKLISIKLIVSHPKIIIRIEDNGKGFNTSEKLKYTNRKHMGLQSMKERTNLMNGEFFISSVINKGTKIKIEIPIKGNVL